MYDECGGCSDKNGYDFDVQEAPDIKAMAESMGCGSAAQAAPVVTMLAAAIGHFLR